MSGLSFAKFGDSDAPGDPPGARSPGAAGDSRAACRCSARDPYASRAVIGHPRASVDSPGADTPGAAFAAYTTRSGASWHTRAPGAVAFYPGAPGHPSDSSSTRAAGVAGATLLPTGPGVNR